MLAALNGAFAPGRAASHPHGSAEVESFARLGQDETRGTGRARAHVRGQATCLRSPSAYVSICPAPREPAEQTRPGLMALQRWRPGLEGRKS